MLPSQLHTVSDGYTVWPLVEVSHRPICLGLTSDELQEHPSVHLATTGGKRPPAVSKAILVLDEAAEGLVGSMLTLPI